MSIGCNMIVCQVGSRISILGSVPENTLWTLALSPRWSTSSMPDLLENLTSFSKLCVLTTMVYTFNTWLCSTHLPFHSSSIGCNMIVCLVGSRISILGSVPENTMWTPVLSVQPHKPCPTGTFSVSLNIRILLILACDVDLSVSLLCIFVCTSSPVSFPHFS